MNIKIKNADVDFEGCFTFLFAKLNDQKLETLKKLGRGYNSVSNNYLKYKIDKRINLYLKV